MILIRNSEGDPILLIDEKHIICLRPDYQNDSLEVTLAAGNVIRIEHARPAEVFEMINQQMGGEPVMHARHVSLMPRPQGPREPTPDPRGINESSLMPPLAEQERQARIRGLQAELERLQNEH